MTDAEHVFILVLSDEEITLIRKEAKRYADPNEVV